MGEYSKIQWTTHTFNPWIGCTKVSNGCKNCYAEVETFARVSKARGLPLWGKDAARHRTKTWREPLRWNREAEMYPDQCTKCGVRLSMDAQEMIGNTRCPSQYRDGKIDPSVPPCGGEVERNVRQRVFCASLCDVFEGRTDLDPWRADLWTLIEQCTELDWMLLTKRPENIRRMVPAAWLTAWPAHVWIGTSTENQEAADERIPHLFEVPARVRFLSCEPLLEAVDLKPWLSIPDAYRCGLADDPHAAWLLREAMAEGLADAARMLSLVIVGGEGHGGRPCDVAWIRSIVKQCAEARVACFVKQLGAMAHLGDCRTDEGNKMDAEGILRGDFLGREASARIVMKHPKGGDPSEWPADLRVREMPRAG